MNTNRFAITVTLGLFGLALALSWLLTHQSALAQPIEWTVCAEGPPTCDYTIIQDAVDAAGEGDVVKVASGDYTDVHGRLTPPGYPDPPPGDTITQVVYISKTVTIRGGYTTDFTEPPDPQANPTALDPQGQGRVVFVTGSTTPSLEGLKITGGSAAGLGGYDWDPGEGVGGGIYVITATATITNNYVLTNAAFRGGGLFLFNSDSTVSRSTFDYNTTTDSFGHGAGIYLYGSGATLSHNIINNNTTYHSLSYGGGIYLDHSDASLSGNTFDDNWGYDGGGVYLYYSEAILADNTITNNSTESWGQGGGVYALYSDATLDGNTIASNTAGEGGGIYLYDSDAEVRGNTVTDNHADKGGGLFLYNISSATVRDNEITSNTAQENGAGLYVDICHATTVLSGNTVASNSAEGDGGGFYLDRRGPTLNGNMIAGNTADNGAGLYLYNCEAALNHNQVSGNDASLDGGGLYLQESNATLNATTIIANTAIWYGGGLYLAASDAELTNNIVADSEANIAGSGMYIVTNCFPQLLHNTIARNVGGNGSGIHVSGDSSAALLNTILVSQTVGINVAAGSSATLQASLWGTGTWANGTDWAGQGSIVTGTINIWDYPAFVDPDMGDYHIGADSAATDSGVNAGVAADIDGEARPAGAGYDIGADELYLAGLIITKQADLEPVAAGSTLTYTLRLTNTGDASLTATITDLLPLHVMPTGLLTWTPDPILPDHTWRETVRVTLETSYAGLLTNVVRATTEEGVSGIYTCTTHVEKPVADLIATNDSPTRLGQATTLTATVTEGSNVTYTWAFGDGETGRGAVVSHTYPSVDICTAVVTASNSVSELTATTTINIVESSMYIHIYLPVILRNTP
jgi:uncharacterized repeat protein (TIGR01451 family)